MKIEKGVVDLSRQDGIRLDGVAAIKAQPGVQDQDDANYRKVATVYADQYRDVAKFKGDTLVWVKIYA